MKKFVMSLVAIVFACSLSFTGMAWADDNLQLGAGQLQGLADSGASALDVRAQAEPQDVGDAVPNSMAQQQFAPMYADGKLVIPEPMQAVKVEQTSSGDGITLTGKSSELAAGTIAIKGTFDFGSKTVGRVSVDGLCDRGYLGKVKVYLDDATEPFATIPLAHVQGKSGWDIVEPRTADVLSQNITGVHTVTFALEAQKASDPTADKKTSILLRSIEFAANSLPVLYFDLDETQGSIDAMNNSGDHSRECYGTVRVQTPAGYTSEYTGETTSELSEQTLDLEYIRGRGNSTWGADKKPYKVKLDKKTDLFGMGANKHWVLLANRYDNSLIRNKMTYWLGQELGLEYTPQCVFVEVVMNGDYLGSYYLCEQVRVGASRVEIDDLDDEPETVEEPGVTGGYLLSMASEGETLSTNKWYTFALESPSFESATPEAKAAQYAYISNFIQKTEDTIFATDFKLDGKSYDSMLDVPSAIDYYWMQMLSKNGDAYGSGSTYLYKKRDTLGVPGKLYWGPLWDFDYVAWGDLEYDYRTVEDFEYESAPWLGRLLLNGSFNDKFIARWAAIKKLMNEVTKAGGKLDQWRDQLAVSRLYDTERWGVYNESWDYYDGTYAAPAQGTQEKRSYADEVNQLRSWINERVAWVDDNLWQLEMKPCKVVFKVDGKTYATVEGIQGNTLSLDVFPKNPKKKGYTFNGWLFMLGDDESTFDDSSSLSGSTITVWADWFKNSQLTPVRNLFFHMKDVYLSTYSEEFIMDYELYPDVAATPTITWTSSNKKVATVGADGEVLPVGVGTTTITAKCDNGVKASYKVHVVESDDENPMEEPYYLNLNKEELNVPAGEVRKLTPELGPTPCYYRSVTWVSLDPVTATVGPTGVVTGMAQGTTYVLAYLSGDPDSLVSCKVTVTKSRLSVSKVKPRAYNGKKVKPSPVVKFAGKKLKRGTDYSVSYGRNNAVGKGWVAIELKGKLYGSKTVTFKIVPKAPVLKSAKKLKNGKLAVTWNKPAKSQRGQITGYQLRWAKSKNMKGAKTKLVKGASKTKLVLAKKVAKNARYVQVRAYKVVKGKKYYSSWSKKK